MTTTQFVKLNLVDDQVYNASMTTTQFVVFSQKKNNNQYWSHDQITLS